MLLRVGPLTGEGLDIGLKKTIDEKRPGFFQAFDIPLVVPTGFEPVFSA